MGYMGAIGMIDAAGFDLALAWHFTSNHFPPLPTTLVPAARTVIEAILRDDIDAEIELPDGVTYRDGRSVAPAWACAEAWHLDAFIDAAYGDPSEVYNA
jgi:hypothetical protein